MTVINSVNPGAVTVVKKPITEAQKVLLNKINNGKNKIKKSRENLQKKNRYRVRYIVEYVVILV